MPSCKRKPLETLGHLKDGIFALLREMDISNLKILMRKPSPFFLLNVTYYTKHTLNYQILVPHRTVLNKIVT